jgi:hypothetical protein
MFMYNVHICFYVYKGFSLLNFLSFKEEISRNMEAGVQQPRYLKLKTKLRGFSPQANYTDQATAACRRS